ncbi:MAG: DUF5697 family protein [Oscillospiraceae bacterium]
MLLTKQQQYILDVIQKLGCVSRRQLAALLRARFCREHPDMAAHLTDVLLRQMRFGNIGLRLEGDLVTLPHIRADPHLAEAVDVMLELSGCEPLDFSAREPPPILLRFTTAGKKISLFAVTYAATALTSAMFAPTERVILLHGGDERLKRLPLANKHFYAVLQADGTHRFFSSDEQN